MVKINQFINWVNLLSTITGKSASLIIYPLMFSLLYEVIARYVFNSPTVWAYDISYMLYGTYFIIGAAYVQLLNRNIAIDIFSSKFSKRKHAIIYTIGYLIFLFPVLIALFWKGIDNAYLSYLQQERSTYSSWEPLLWIFKSMLPIGIFFLLLQAICDFCKYVNLSLGGDNYER
ncbi:MAG TPA: C4-dicarboxylate ABC transporter substrate-binding protein [Coxiellaceae bacterium]|nr:C4-dicarboxylate ABC transporter substrate-binding protein [Coxiellaceae bacterium]HBY55580.1 C4-dicarboxylate ABC transporter substrate-binding protein [Coxiellaceae bacterium]